MKYILIETLGFDCAQPSNVSGLSAVEAHSPAEGI
jgi:hypothetical protein